MLGFSDGRLRGPNPLCDIPLVVSREALVIPTVGSIIPNWVLVVPRVPALSLTALSSDHRAALLQVARDAANIMGNGTNTVLFEHGPSTTSSLVGCGVDHAHLHVVNTEINFVASALEDETVVWSQISCDDPWESLAGSEYYFLRAHVGSYVGFPRLRTSQFFRRHIARAAGVPHQWDYNRWPHYNHVRQTYERFNRGFSAVA